MPYCSFLFVVVFPLAFPLWFCSLSRERKRGRDYKGSVDEREKKEASARQIREVGCLATEIKIGRSLCDLNNSMPVMVRHDKLAMKGLDELLSLCCSSKRLPSWCVSATLKYRRRKNKAVKPSGRRATKLLDLNRHTNKCFRASLGDTCKTRVTISHQDALDFHFVYNFA